MAQQEVWEKEYNEKKLVGGDKPAASFRAFVKYLKKEFRKQRRDNGKPDSDGFVFQGMNILDLGSGEGKNALYCAERGGNVLGIEIARNAVETAYKSAELKDREIRVARGLLRYELGSIGEKLDVKTDSQDIVLDVTSSNSLNEIERTVYLDEVERVLKKGGYFFVRALCKDSDNNAKQLVKDFPGPDKDTYTMPDLGLTERVFTESDFREMYGSRFDILKLKKEFHYTRFQDRTYKRAFWIAYMQK